MQLASNCFVASAGEKLKHVRFIVISYRSVASRMGRAESGSTFEYQEHFLGVKAAGA
jgi:hypothetical protein